MDKARELLQRVYDEVKWNGDWECYELDYQLVRDIEELLYPLNEGGSDEQ